MPFSEIPKDHLLHPRRLAECLQESGVAGLLELCRARQADPEIRELLEAVELSRHAVATHPDELFSQLAGRLRESHSSKIQAFLAELEHDRSQWLNPRTPSLTAPGGPLVRVLGRHGGSPAPIVLVNRDRQALGGCQLGRLHLFDLDTGAELASFGGPDIGMFAVNGLAVDEELNLVLAASGNGELHVFDLERRELVHQVTDQEGWILAVCLLPEHRVALGGRDRVLRIRSLTTGELLTSFDGFDEEISALVSLGGDLLAVGLGDGVASLRTLDGNEIRSWKAHETSISSLALLKRNRLLTGSRDERVAVWAIDDATTEPRPLQVWMPHAGSVNCVAVSSDGSRIVTSHDSGQLLAWNCSGENSFTIAAHAESATGLALSRDGRVAVTASTENKIKQFQIDRPCTAEQTRPHAGGVTSLAISADSQRVISAAKDQTVKVWDARGGMLMELPGHARWVNTVSLLWDGRRALSASAWESKIRVWDLQNRSLLQSLDGIDGWTFPAALTQDGRYFLATTWNQNVALMDLEAGGRLAAELGANDGSRSLTALAVSGDGGRILAGYEDGLVTVFDTATRTEIDSVACHQGRVSALAASHDGSVVVSGSEFGEVRRWDAYRIRSVGLLEDEPGEYVPEVAVTGDGRRAVYARGDAVHVWRIDADGAEEIGRFTADAVVHACAIAPDGSFCVAGDTTGQLHFLAIMEPA